MKSRFESQSNTSTASGTCVTLQHTESESAGCMVCVALGVCVYLVVSADATLKRRVRGLLKVKKRSSKLDR